MKSSCRKQNKQTEIRNFGAIDHEFNKGAPGKFSNEEGSIMVVALIMLVLLTLIGISASTTTEFETQIAGNEKFHKTAFYNAESGLYVTPKVISAFVDSGSGTTESLTGISFLDSSGEPDAADSTLDDVFYNEIMGYDELLGRDAHDSANDVRFALGTHNVNVDVERTGQEILTGGGAEFGSGAEGVGVGSTGGVALLFAVDSFGDGPSTAQSNLEADYRKVVGTAGGL